MPLVRIFAETVGNALELDFFSKYMASGKVCLDGSTFKFKGKKHLVCIDGLSKELFMEVSARIL